MIARHCLLIGWLFILWSLPEPALAQRRLIDSLKTTLRVKAPDTTRGNTYYDIANAFFKLAQYDSADFYLTRSRQLHLRQRNLAGLGDYNRLKGAMARNRGQLDESLAFQQAAITYYQKAGKLRQLAQSYSNMGLLYKTMGEEQPEHTYTRQALHYIQQAVALNQRLHQTANLVGNYINQGIIYEDLGEYKLGRDCFFKGLALNEQVGTDPEDSRILYNNLGKNYNAEGQHQQAIGYLNKALAINLRLKRNSSLGHNYRNLSVAYLGLGEPAKALDYAEKAVGYGKAGNDVPLQKTLYRALADASVAAGQYQKAYEALQTQKRIEDSLMGVEKTRIITQLEGKYRVQQANELARIQANLELAKTQEIARVEAHKDAEIATIQAEENRQVARVRASAEVEKTRLLADVQTNFDAQKRRQQILHLDQENKQRSRQIQQLVGGLVLLFALLSALIGQYYVIQQSNRRLAEQNDTITRNSQQLATQTDQLRTLMKELHHRVKNNLAIVSSLLSLQVSGLRDEKAIQAIRVGQQRVEAMSLIHQQLYRTDQLTVIDMYEYLTNLAGSLVRAYGYREDEFRLQIDIEKRELDVEVAIPLGLIVNELITNAFKYAFDKEKQPLLRIGLRTSDTLFPMGLTLEVQDNGPGISVADWRRAGKFTSFGRLLITSLSQQLEGQFELSGENGTLFRLHIPPTRLAA